MASLQLNAKVIRVAIFISVIFFMSLQTGFGMMSGVCRPFCTGSECITVNVDRKDFQTAEEACRNRNGQLMTFQNDTDKSTLDILIQELYGDFWIGLHLPAVACSNLSTPLRGYEWTSGSVHSNFIPSFSTWKESVKVCSPRCVSLSSDLKWTEKLCSDRIDGFLCKTRHKDACQAQELSDPNVIKSTEDCSTGPCEHRCKDVKGGYICSCFQGYIPDSKHPEQCKMYCAKQKCPVICKYGNKDGPCYCPDGFLRNDEFCEDIDECFGDQCHQECKNTFGSFVCSCREGFVLKDQVKCIKVNGSERFVVTTPSAIASVKPTTDDQALTSSSVPASGFLWMWIFLVVAVAVAIILIRFYVVRRQKRREQNLQSAAPVHNIEC